MGKNHKQLHLAKLFEHTKKLRSRYLNTLAALKLYDRINQLSAPNVVGKKRANANVEVFSRYKYFFLTSKEATRCYLLIELAKFFDNSGQSLTINTVLTYAEKNINSFSKNEFQKFYKERSILSEIFKGYKVLEKKDLRKIKKRLVNNKKVINDLKTYRDKYLAHDDIQKIEVKITKKDVRTLMKIIKDTIELFYNKLDFASNSYKNFEEEPVRDIDNMVDTLKEYEKQRG